jgi:hypothetical protein
MLRILNAAGVSVNFAIETSPPVGVGSDGRAYGGVTWFVRDERSTQRRVARRAVFSRVRAASSFAISASNDPRLIAALRDRRFGGAENLREPTLLYTVRVMRVLLSSTPIRYRVVVQSE